MIQKKHSGGQLAEYMYHRTAIDTRIIKDIPHAVTPADFANSWNFGLTTYQFLITSQNAGKGRSFCRQRMRRRNPRLNKETKLR